MAVAPTGAIFKSLIFDNENSRNYGVYITGEAVYNAPEREVEMISIPGRNGAFALDKGRFENIEVTYHAGIFADTEDDFAQAVSDFRNVLCSRSGYCKLTDEYNLDEYRMAIYKSGLEVAPATLRAGEFDIVFDCKPQRYLMSGESELSVSDGDVILNPTLFDASPLLEVEGYGTIGFNGYEIEIENAVMGEIETSQKSYDSFQKSVTLQKAIGYEEKLNAVRAGDSLFLDGLKVHEQVQYIAYTGQAPTPTTTATGISTDDITVTSSVYNNSSSVIESATFYLDISLPSIELTAFTDETITATVTMDAVGKDSHNTTVTLTTLTVDLTITNMASGALLIEMQFTYVEGHGGLPTGNAEVGKTYIDSTLSVLGTPTYIDCELGEVYMVNSGTVISLNQHVDLGSDLPKLASGQNEIAFDNTITDLKIIPKWWQI